jgi:hypothetical protein
MSSSIFDSIDRKLEGGAPEGISQFDYLNESNRREAGRVRAALDGYLSRYPAEHQAKLRGRLRTVDDIGFRGAAFELVLHELLIRSGQRILEVEPKLPHTERSPDFSVEAPNGTQYYLEATLATGRSSADEASQKRLDQAFKAINDVHSPDFFLSVQYSGTPTKPVTGKALKRQLQKWLDGLSYGAIVAEYDAGGPDAVPHFPYEEHGLSFSITVIPRKHRGNNTPGRAIGVRSMEPLWVQPHGPIRDAVASKATRYGDLDRPFVIAVNALSDYADADDAVDALFGNLALQVTTFVDGPQREQTTRTEDGAWTSTRNTRVSAIFSTERLSPWSLGHVRSRLIYNPWARRELTIAPLAVEQWRPQRGKLVRSAGSNIAGILALPEGWPE